MGAALKKIGSGIHKASDALFNVNDTAGVVGGQHGMPPTPEMGMISNVGDAVTLAKSAKKIAEPGPAPNSAIGNALISGGKLGLSLFGEMLMPGQGATMVGMVADQAKALGDAVLPDGSAGAVGGLVNRVTGGAVGGGPEERPAVATPEEAPPPVAAQPATPQPAAPVPAAAPAAPARAFPNSPLGDDQDVLDRLSK